MDVQHTPGPWGDGNEAICVKIDRERPWAGTVFRRHYDSSEANALVAMTFAASVDEATANARLIAAAPDLLEALELILRRTKHTSSALYSPVLRDISAIAFTAVVNARGDA